MAETVSSGLELVIALDDYAEKVMLAQDELKQLYNSDIDIDDPKFFELTSLEFPITKCVDVSKEYFHLLEKLQKTQKWLYQYAGPKVQKNLTENIKKALEDIRNAIHCLCDISDYLHPAEKMKMKFKHRDSYKKSIDENLQVIHDNTKILRKFVDSSDSQDTVKTEQQFKSVKEPVELDSEVESKSGNMAEGNSKDCLHDFRFVKTVIPSAADKVWRSESQEGNMNINEKPKIDYLTSKDRELFHKIAIDIKKNTEKYREAGKWLDEYYDATNFWHMKEKQLKELRQKWEKDGDSHQSVLAQEIEYLELMIEIKHFMPLSTIATMRHGDKALSTTELKQHLVKIGNPEEDNALLQRFLDAQDSFLRDNVYEGFFSLENARRFCLITWLMTDPDAENAGLDITKFEYFLWDTGDSDRSSLCYLTFFFLYSRLAWIKLVHIAWAKLEAEKEEKPEQKKDQTTEQIKDKTEQNNAYIKKKTSAWGFGFNSEAAQVTFKHGNELKGLALIEFLLINRNKEYTPLKLLQETGQREKGEVEPEKIYTGVDIRKIENDIESLDGIAKSTTDLEKKEELEQKVKDAKAILYKARNCMGKSRKISEKYTKSVSRNIGTVLEKIAPQNVKLYNHLNIFLNRGEICCYKPDTEIFWEIS